MIKINRWLLVAVSLLTQGGCVVVTETRTTRPYWSLPPPTYRYYEPRPYYRPYPPPRRPYYREHRWHRGGYYP
jgi:hypothetical protein